MTHILLRLIHEIELVKVRHPHPGIGISALLCVFEGGIGWITIVVEGKAISQYIILKPGFFY